MGESDKRCASSGDSRISDVVIEEMDKIVVVEGGAYPLVLELQSPFFYV